jgi:hypothetical protein
MSRPRARRQGAQAMKRRALRTPKARRVLLDVLAEERTRHALSASVSLSMEKVAEEFAREVLADDTFRREIREMIRRHADAWLADMRGARQKETR